VSFSIKVLIVSSISDHVIVIVLQLGVMDQIHLTAIPAWLMPQVNFVSAISSGLVMIVHSLSGLVIPNAITHSVVQVLPHQTV
jgi:hypothetical protein